MSASRAVFRLWIFGGVFWIGYWGWNYLTECLRSANGVLFCPTASGEALSRTDYLHAIILVGLPLWPYIIWYLGSWAMRGFPIRRG